MEKKKDKKKYIIGAIVAAVIVAALVAYLVMTNVVIPKQNATKAYEGFVNQYQSLLDKGEYDAVSKNAETVLSSHKDALEENQIHFLNGMVHYTKAVKALDYTDNLPSSQESASSAKTELSEAMTGFDHESDEYIICNTLLDSIDEYNEFYVAVTGTLEVDHSKYKKKASSKKDDAEGVSFQFDRTPTYGDGDFEGASVIPVANTGRRLTDPDDSSGPGVDVEYKPGTDSSTDSDTESTDEEKDEPKKKEKPPVHKYKCSGYMNVGFRKINDGYGLTKNNIQTVYQLHIDVLDEPEEEDVSTEYNTVFKTEQPTDIIVTGNKEGAEAEGEFEPYQVLADFGNGISLTISAETDPSYYEDDEEDEDFDSYSGGYSSGSSSKKDYAEGSEWEDYDSDKDGHISDDEFQDATNDYLDEYYGDDSSDGTDHKDYSEGSEWEDYDSDSDGQISDSEFQDAVGDYMDQHGY